MIRTAVISSFAAAFILGGSVAANAQNTCNGLLAIEYVTVQTPNVVGSIDRVKLSIGAGSISGGNQLSVSQLLFGLDCKSRVCSNDTSNACSNHSECPGGFCLAILPTCIDDGSVAGYVGNISTTCPGVSWSANSGGGASPNEVMFTANAPVVIPESTFPFCELEFDFRKLSATSNDATPNTIEQTAGFEMASCNNGLAAASRISGAVGIDAERDTTPGPLPAPALGTTALAATAGLLVAAGIASVRRRRRRN